MGSICFPLWTTLNMEGLKISPAQVTMQGVEGLDWRISLYLVTNLAAPPTGS
jgi:hypothetical protein